MKKSILLIVLVCFILPLVAQEVLNQVVDLHIEDKPLAEAFYQLIDQEDVKLSFRNDHLPNDHLSIHINQQPLYIVLDELLSDKELSYRVVGSQVLIIPKLPSSELRYYTLSGFVSDLSTGEHLIGASITSIESNRVAVSNEYGFFSITLPSGINTINISYIGYQKWQESIDLDSDLNLKTELTASITLQEVVIYAYDSLSNPIGGMATGANLGLRETQLLPSLAGEPDIVRTALLLPGVTSGADGADGLQIRGGDAGQNLVLLDGVPVYYVNHAIGLFSIFNSNAIRSAQLLRGGFPARYSGRLSSVLDIRMKEGNDQEFQSSFELGLLSSRFSLEGPIQKGRTSFFVSGRWSFVHHLLRPQSATFKKNRGQEGLTDYRFNDLNLKLNHNFSSKDRVFLSIYRGEDGYHDLTFTNSTLEISNGGGTVLDYDIKQFYEEGISWKNSVGALRWNHIFNNQLFANFSVNYSELAQSSFFDQLDTSYEKTFSERDTSINKGLFESGIKDIGIQADWHFLPSPSQEFRFGIGSHQRIFRPGALILEESFEDSPFSNNRIFTTELSGYVENQGQWRSKWKYNAGLHFSSWFVREKNYSSIQPRLNIEYQLTKKSFLKTSLSRMVQYLHLLNNTTAGLPTEIWVPSTEQTSPGAAWIGSVGYRMNFGDQFRFETEAYYKKMDDLLSFKVGVESFEDWEENSIQGVGKSYGVEFMLSKTSGKLTGWLSYTYSRSERQFEGINSSRIYPFRYDRPHDFKAAIIYRLRPKVYFSANWIYSSGFAFTLPLIKFSVGLPGDLLLGDFNPEIFTADAKNNYRMPEYHRLDLNLHFEWSSQSDVLNHHLNIGIYNAYNRNNPLYYDVRLFFVNQDFDLTTRFSFVEVQLTPILPSLSYQLSF